MYLSLSLWEEQDQGYNTYAHDQVPCCDNQLVKGEVAPVVIRALDLVHY